MATQAERDARLDALVEAVNSWADKKKKYLTDQVALSKRILKGRTGAERLNNAAATASAELMAEEIDQFLTG